MGLLSRKEKDYSSKCEDGKRTLREVAAEASHKAHDLYDHAYDDVSYVKQNIRSNPIQSSVLALFIGYMLGSLFGR